MIGTQQYINRGGGGPNLLGGEKDSESAYWPSSSSILSPDSIPSLPSWS